MKSSDLRRVEWPTMLVAAIIYGGWLAVVFNHEALGTPLAVGLLALLIAWQGSLQHEVLHGHPFNGPVLNEILGSVPINLRLPYRVYRRSHLRHHACGDLTDPATDTESFFVKASTWKRLPASGRWFLLAHHTLLGRMLLGPLVENITLWRHSISEIRSGDGRLFRWWVAHLVQVALLLVLLVVVAGFPWLPYVLAVYVANGLGLVRSYCEHQWVAGEETRSIVVGSRGFWALLFLNNNLHDTHHEEPAVAWFRLPKLARSLGSAELAAQGAGCYSGYGEIFRKHLLRPFDHPVHPAERKLESGI